MGRRDASGAARRVPGARWTAETSAPEELEPLELTKLRDLEVVRDADDEGRPGYIVSASAVVRRADHVYVVGDDELDIAVFRSSESGPGELRQALAGDLPDADDERAREKPDLEALSVLPPFEGAPFGGLLELAPAGAPGATAASTGRSTQRGRSRASR